MQGIFSYHSTTGSQLFDCSKIRLYVVKQICYGWFVYQHSVSLLRGGVLAMFLHLPEERFRKYLT